MSREAEKKYGRESVEAAEALLILGSAHYVLEDYKRAESIFVRYTKIVKAKLGPHTLEVFHGLETLAEIYFLLHRYPEAVGLNDEAKSISKKIDPCADDPILEALVSQAGAYKTKTDLTSRQLGFVVPLMAVSWCITRGWHRGSAGVQTLNDLRVFCTSYGIDKDGWEWVAKHAHLTRYDFVGFLSILIHHKRLAPSLSAPAARGGLQVVEVR